MSEPTVLSGATIAADDGLRTDAWIAFDTSGILEIGSGRPPAGSVDTGGCTVLPGFVDLHNHGGLGEVFGETIAGSTAAARLHRRSGTTTLIASVATAPVDTMLDRVALLAQLARSGEIDGIHLEGPFLSAGHRGAHDERLLLAPDRAIMQGLLDVGEGAVRIVTLAPEIPGAGELIDDLVAQGVVVAVGHTSADAAQARDSFARGARLVTHLFNGMPGIHHREPGPIPVALGDERVVVELIADGHHVDPLVLDLPLGTAGAGRIALITDASRATGVGDGDFGEIVVVDGAARTRDGRSLAGSVLTMDAAVRAVLGSGWSIREAAIAAAATPAGVLGLAGTGALTPGFAADLVVLDHDMRVRDVYRRGVRAA